VRCRATSRRDLEVPDAAARQVQPQTKPVSARTGGVKYGVVARSGSGAQGDSGYGQSRRLKNRMKLLVTRLAE
jgi:hypothetical protein